MKQLLNWINPKMLSPYNLSMNYNAINYLFKIGNLRLINWNGLCKKY